MAKQPSENAEPRAADSPHGPPLLYVIQKHAATRLHYDLRLELDGVLKSWAIPKGPCYDTSQKRLAVLVEDHPLDYASFEGVIPADEYGRGTVMLWDRGQWQAIGDPHEGFAKGELRFQLVGQKLRGAWKLIRMGGRGREGENWLLIKSKDEHVRRLAEYDVVAAEPDSAATGRSMQQIAEGKAPGDAG